MKITFSKDAFDNYIDKNAQSCIDAANRYFSTIWVSRRGISTDECVNELQKVLPNKAKYREKNDMKYIIELEVEEKDYVMFLLKYKV